jgi:hypothetical protein
VPCACAAIGTLSALATAAAARKIFRMAHSFALESTCGGPMPRALHCSLEVAVVYAAFSGNFRG